MARLDGQGLHDSFLDFGQEPIVVEVDADQGLLLCFSDALHNRQDPFLQIQA